MAIYREPSPNRVFVPIAVVVGLALILLVAFFILRNNNSTPTPPDDHQINSAALDKITASLDLFQTEYAKVNTGVAASQTGAPGAINTAITTLNATASLSKLNKIVYADLQTNLGTINTAARAVPAPDVKKLVASALQKIETLRTANSSAAVTATTH